MPKKWKNETGENLPQVYWKLGEKGATIPDTWEPSYGTEYGKDNPMNISLNGTEYHSYISVGKIEFLF
jgi:hypothetical protein